MSDQWGRVESPGWPSDKPLWTIGALVLALAAISLGALANYQWSWTPLQRYWLADYLVSTLRTGAKDAVGYYRVLNVVDARGRTRLVTDADIVPGETVLPGHRTLPFQLSEEAQRTGLQLVLAPRQKYRNQDVKEILMDRIYAGEELSDLIRPPLLLGLGFLLGGMITAVPQDRRRALLRKHGRRLRGPEEVTAAEFNRRNQSNGIAFPTLEPGTFMEKILGRYSGHVLIPKSLEDNHFLFMGDSGSGKSSLIRETLIDIAERGETAVVYDPALEYTGQFYRPERGDVILNPLDQRMPYWSPAEEVTHPAEALTLAASLFQDTNRENPFFVQGPRKIFAHLLNLKPTTDDLLHWLSNQDELEARLKGTDLSGLIYEHAGPQRGGMFGALSMVSDSLKLLPRREETAAEWSAANWSKQRQGWVFVTSVPESREQLRPLISMWLDMMILRLMNRGRPGPRPVWFVFDELSSLHQLPQLVTAITENRKSGNPVVLCFQGRSQLEDIYGRQAEVIFSQPATKIFLRTSEPHSARWISDTIGEVEIERLTESRTRAQTQGQRESRSYQLGRELRPLVMKEEISGLPKGHGFLKCGNLVVRLSFPYVSLPKNHPDFLERPITAPPLTAPLRRTRSDNTALEDPLKRNDPAQASAATQEEFWK